MINIFENIDATSLYKRMRACGDVDLVDVRSSAEYVSGHAEGAKSIPLETLDRALVQSTLGSSAGITKPIHLICEAGPRAEQAARNLNVQGLTELVLVEGGTRAWMSKDLPIKRSGAAISIEQQTQIAVGLLILVLVAKGMMLHTLFFAFVGLLGVGLIVSGVTSRCALSGLLARMPWNSRPVVQSQITLTR